MSTQQTYWCEVCASPVTGPGIFIGGTSIQPEVVRWPNQAKVHLCSRCVHMISDAVDSDSMVAPG